MFCLGKFGTGPYSFMVEKSLMHKLSTTCLDGKVVLGKCNFSLAWVAILRHKIACISCKHYVINLTFSSFGQVYHFADVGKMISNLFSCICGGFFCFFNDKLEVTPLYITHYGRKFTCAPAFYTVVFERNRFKNVE